jgi:hypothetical protein
VVGCPTVAVVAAVAAWDVVDHQDGDLPLGRGGTDQRVHFVADLSGVVLGEPDTLRGRGEALGDDLGAGIVRVLPDPDRR